MSSIFDLTDNRKRSNRKVSENFFKKCGFYKDRWGSLEDRKKETSVFFEHLVGSEGLIDWKHDEETPVIATIQYFPKEFDRYTTIGRKWGYGNVAGELVITYETRTWEYSNEHGFTDTMIFDCKTHADFYDAIDCFNIDLMQKDYESIRFE